MKIELREKKEEVKDVANIWLCKKKTKKEDKNKNAISKYRRKI